MQENAARRSNWADHNIALRFNWRRSHWGGGFTIWACIDAPRPTSTELCEYIRLQITLRCIALQFACLTPPQLCKVTMGNPSLGEPPPITMGCDFQWEKHVQGLGGVCVAGLQWAGGDKQPLAQFPPCALPPVPIAVSNSGVVWLQLEECLLARVSSMHGWRVRDPALSLEF